MTWIPVEIRSESRGAELWKIQGRALAPFFFDDPFKFITDFAIKTCALGSLSNMHSPISFLLTVPLFCSSLSEQSRPLGEAELFLILQG